MVVCFLFTLLQGEEGGWKLAKGSLFTFRTMERLWGEIPLFQFQSFQCLFEVGSRSAKAQLNSLVVDGLTAKQTLPILHGRGMHDNDQKANNGVDDHQTVVVSTVNTFFWRKVIHRVCVCVCVCGYNIAKDRSRNTADKKRRDGSTVILIVDISWR